MKKLTLADYADYVLAALAVGIVITLLGWYWIGPRVQMPFFNDFVVICMAILGGILMFVASYALRITRMMRTR